eukprot:CAMPEP_0194276186 /NCGR_PEP_ID=MMETSP0169-20130528/8841_1 /TAXON_ID=218684 /ORGANISM="Corethron pennatum, Strain L29A3" /LENGTH=245 /DNA_ID=CAMNT_0039019839 /DNA_START=143 /DNA_END=876 /DNA_ORIENTATION=+
MIAAGVMSPPVLPPSSGAVDDLDDILGGGGAPPHPAPVPAPAVPPIATTSRATSPAPISAVHSVAPPIAATSRPPSPNATPVVPPPPAAAVTAPAGPSGQVKKLRDANSRYKSLLTLARSRIEEQEKQIQELENRLASLGTAPPPNGGSGGGGGGDDGGELDADEWEVRSVYRVVESEGSGASGDAPTETWALMDFVRIVREDAPPAPEGHAGGRRRRWVRFGGLQELADHVRRDTGEPVVLPEP